MGFEHLDTIYYFVLFFVALFAGFIDSIVGGGGLITLPALIACGIPAHLFWQPINSKVSLALLQRL